MYFQRHLRYIHVPQIIIRVLSEHGGNLIRIKQTIHSERYGHIPQRMIRFPSVAADVLGGGYIVSCP
jgi:hypothetical protein